MCITPRHTPRTPECPRLKYAQVQPRARALQGKYTLSSHTGLMQVLPRHPLADPKREWQSLCRTTQKRQGQTESGGWKAALGVGDGVRLPPTRVPGPGGRLPAVAVQGRARRGEGGWVTASGCGDGDGDGDGEGRAGTGGGGDQHQHKHRPKPGGARSPEPGARGFKRGPDLRALPLSPPPPPGRPPPSRPPPSSGAAPPPPPPHRRSPARPHPRPPSAPASPGPAPARLELPVNRAAPYAAGAGPPARVGRPRSVASGFRAVLRETHASHRAGRARGAEGRWHGAGPGVVRSAA